MKRTMNDFKIFFCRILVVEISLYGLYGSLEKKIVVLGRGGKAKTDSVVVAVKKCSWPSPSLPSASPSPTRPVVTLNIF